jgi:2-oxoisovalerate dehydrogenase E1 component
VEITGPAAALTHDELVALYELMVLGRTLETRLHNLHRSDQLGGVVYPGVGQEAAMVGFAAALDPGDVLGGTHRDLIMQLTRGVTIEEALLNFYGKVAGPSRGRDGNSHFGVLDKGTLMVVSPLPDAYPVAMGCALAFKQQDAGRVALADCGEGATATGTWHETLNMAAVLSLPIVFTVQDNRSADASSRSAAIEYLSERAVAYGIPGWSVDGNDIVACYNVARAAVERARTGGGPTLIEAKTFRHFSGGDGGEQQNSGNRERDRDPIERFESLLIDLGVLDDLRVIQVAEAVTRTIQDAMERVPEEQDPDPATVGDDLFAVRAGPSGPEPGEPQGEAVTMLGAINATLAEEMGRDDSVFLLGEDVGASGGAFQATAGLEARFGPNRIVATPIAGAGIVGAAVGAALMGQRPIVELQYADFIYGGLDLLVNEAAKYHWKAGTPVPIVLRGPGGAGLRAGPFHSLSPEGLLAHHPGIKVVCPSTPTNAKGLLLAAIRDPNPVVFLEHKKLYQSIEEPIPSGDYEIPLGAARVVREGGDVTVVAWSAMVQVALAAAERLEAEGVAVEVIDLQTIVPLDWETITASVGKTSRLVVVQEDQPFASVASEIGAGAASDLFWHLDAPVIRVTPPHAHVPFAAVLEDAYVPGVDDVVAAVRMVTAA